MKKCLLIAAILLCCIMLLTACGCEHEWVDADCVNPMTCALCQETEGAPLGHSWMAATCEQPKSCENCDATEGEAKGHQWEDATCIAPKKCAICFKTEGNPISHQWEEATTEAPKTCVNCQMTDGDKINVDPRFTTESTKELYGEWICDVVLTGDMIDMEGYIEELPCTLRYEFTRTGELKASVEIGDLFAFMDELKQATLDAMYCQTSSIPFISELMRMSSDSLAS